LNSKQIDFSKIKQPPVKALLQKNNLFSLSDLSKLRSLCYNPSDGQHYYKHVKSFVVQASIINVWNTYKTISPQETRNGSMVSFGLMYSRRQNQIMYPGDSYTGIEAGQIIFLNLNLLGNFIQLAVGHEITDVNEIDRTIKICYLQNGASTGTQLIKLKESKQYQTEVVHETWYRSGSFFRDKVLYPGFHKKGLTEFHENVKRKAEELAL
jgi:hypothetical protein